MTPQNLPSSEADFLSEYGQVEEPSDQIRLLANWRRFQMQVVSAFTAQMRLFANEQYSSIDHFLLELLQNADDNTYPTGVSPTVRIELTEKTFLLFNNEVGFNRENLFAITYAAFSTKTRDKSAATFIGEKGIGFKSVFSVADAVEVHSGSYHFRLDNNEYVIPHEIPGESVTGTQIRLHLKEGNAHIPKILSQRLQKLGASSQEFILFLQKIEGLVVIDNLANTHSEVTIQRQAETGSFVLQTNGKRVKFRTFRYLVDLSAEVVATRYENQGPLHREVVFAVPVPSDKDYDLQGRLFCFLPTNVHTAVPLHIQIDAKTTTNRENIEPFINSRWNTAIFRDFVDQMVKVYLELTRDQVYYAKMPSYWPYNIESQTLQNDDLKALLGDVKSRLQHEPIILDQHGIFKHPKRIRILPPEYRIWFNEPKYEHALSRHLWTESVTSWQTRWGDCNNIDPDTAFSFLDPTWAATHRKAVEAMGVTVLTLENCLTILKEGPPSTVDINNDDQVRDFLRFIQSIAKAVRPAQSWMSDHQLSALKRCPVFPLKQKDIRRWGALHTKVFFLTGDSPLATTEDDALLVDPRFTYTPGGSAREGIREFNQMFRELLGTTFNVMRYSRTELIRQTTLQELKREPANLNDLAQRQKMTNQWQRLHDELWHRRIAIERDERKSYWNEIIAEFRKCYVPTRSMQEPGWKATLVPFAFLGSQFNTPFNLEKLYASTDAPFIHFDLLIEGGFDTNSWTELLHTCDAKVGPYIVESELKDLNAGEYEASTSLAYKDGKDTFGQSIITAIQAHYEFKNDPYATGFTVSLSSKTFSLDKYSLTILYNKYSFVARHLSTFWNKFRDIQTYVGFGFGYKHNARYVFIKDALLYEQLRKGLWLETNLGLCLSTECYLDTPFNRDVLGDSVPLVNSNLHGYHVDLLKLIGVKQKVTIQELFNRLNGWFQATPSEQRASDNFIKILLPILRMVDVDPSTRTVIHSSLYLYSRARDQLIRPLQWLRVIAPNEYPADFVQRIKDLCATEDLTSPEALISHLLSLNINADHAELARLLVRIGERADTADAPEIKRLFLSQLSEEGLQFGDTILKSVAQFPLLWDTSPLPLDSSFIIAIPLDYWDSAPFYAGTTLLGWDTFSVLSSQVSFEGNPSELSQPVALQAELVLSEIISYPTLTELVRLKLRELNLLKDITSIRSRIHLVEYLYLDLEWSNIQQKVPVPYWYDGAYLTLSRQVAVEQVLPDLLDTRTGTTFSGLFKYIWDAKREESHNLEQRGSHPPLLKGSNAEEKGGALKGPLGNAYEDVPSKDTRSGSSPSDQYEASATEEPRASSDVTKRRRLFSSVLPPSDEEHEQERHASQVERSKTVEAAGIHHLHTYLDKLGASWVSAETENKGYDFEITYGSYRFFVELKSSADYWDGWEHNLTPNEFFTAKRYGDRYFLCVIDRVLDDDWQLYFIQNPAGLATGFLFDHPWRAISIDLATHLQQFS